MENQATSTMGAGTTASMGTPDTAASTARSAHDMVDRVAQTAHETVDRIAAKAGPTMERMRSGTGSAREQMQARMDQFGDMEEQWVETARSYVREHPFAALAVAALAGALVARITSHR
jgi:ElaB/YqjD/DUF883 family membrane-anchored ribosome-binding protein